MRNKKPKSQDELIEKVGLTGQIGHVLELLLPELGDADGLLLLVHAGAGHPLDVGVVHDLAQVLRVDGVEDVEEVLPRRPLVLRVLGREVLHELGVLLELGPEAPDRELVVMRHLDVVDVGLQNERLLAREDLLQEVVGDQVLIGQVILL